MIALAVAALAVLLPAAQISHVPGPVLHGAAAEIFGGTVRGAGDVNGDGFADILVSATKQQGGVVVRAFSGLDGTLLLTFDGLAAFGIDAAPCAAAGDVNGDGHADVFVGNAVAGTASLRSGLDGSTIFAFAGDVPGDGLGGALGNAGDVDGDGRPDAILGNTGQWSTGAAGYARVFSGANGSPLLTLHQESAGDSFGTAVCGLGDVDGDGHDDLVVGAHSDGVDYLDPGFPPFIPPFWAEDQSGYVTVFSGATGAIVWAAHGDAKYDGLGWSVASIGDVNGDGVSDVLAGCVAELHDTPGYARLLSGADGSTLRTFTAASLGQVFVAVSGAGDVDLDGVPDVMVGNLPDGGPAVGEVRIFSGANGSVLFSETNITGLPVSVAGLGDVNADGVDDFAVGAPYPANGAGSAQIFWSQAAPPLVESYGCGGNPSGSLVYRGGPPALGQSFTLTLDDPTHSLRLPAVAWLLLASQPDSHFPCGTMKPKWGLGAPGSAGELLVSVVAPNPLVLNVGLLTGAPLELALTVPALDVLVGVKVYVQGALVDSAHRVGLTEAVALTIGVP